MVQLASIQDNETATPLVLYLLQSDLTMLVNIKALK